MDWKEEMRLLWFENTMWARHYIGSVMYGLHDSSAVAQRTFRSSRDLSQLYAAYYGPAAASQIETLLNQDILIVSEIASTMRMRQDIGPLIAYWDQNRDALANVIALADPKIDPTVFKDALDAKFQGELDLIQALVNEQYAQSIDKFDYLRDSAFRIADISIASIASQYSA